MNLNMERKDDTEAIIEIAATAEELLKIKNKVLKKLASKVKVSGFRDGKIPIAVVEKNVSSDVLQSEFIDEAVNTLYIAAIKNERLRPVGQPKVDIKKFVPFTALEVIINLPVVGEVKLANYKVLKSKRNALKLDKKKIDEVIENLLSRGATKREVSSEAADKDEVIIDFKGVDVKGKSVKGADGKDYSLVIGSKAFIPGFEENLIGMKAGDKKDFDVTFPKDYGVKSLQKAKVTFSVTIKKVNEVSRPKLDDDFAAQIGPFKTVDELKADIKKQLEIEESQKIERDYEEAILKEISDKTKVKIPDTLIKEQEGIVLREVKQNVVQRGLTFKEFLDNQKTTEDDYMKKEIVPEAKRRIKAGLILNEIADLEGVTVSEEELNTRITQLKARYNDPKMVEQLDAEENRRELKSRLRSEKVIIFLKTR